MTSILNHKTQFPIYHEIYQIANRGEKMDLPPKMQQQLAQFEQLRQQLQLVSNQRVNLEARVKELESTLEELESIGDSTQIYRGVGSLFVKADTKEEVVEKLKEEKETAEVRVKTVTKQEEQLKERYNDLQQELQDSLKKMQGLGPA
jgi:prefoldin beta subunit